jgi:insulysin
MKVNLTKQNLGMVLNIQNQRFQVKFSRIGLKNFLNSNSLNPVIDENLFISPPNPFVPENLDLKKFDKELDPHRIPVVIKESKYEKIWFKQDIIFKRPKAILFFNCILPITYTTPQNMIYSRIFCELVVDSLNEYSYDASVANLNFNVSASSDGFQVVVAGYDDKISILTSKVFEGISNLKVDKERFFIFKEKVFPKGKF